MLHSDASRAGNAMPGFKANLRHPDGRGFYPGNELSLQVSPETDARSAMTEDAGISRRF